MRNQRGGQITLLFSKRRNMEWTDQRFGASFQTKFTYQCWLRLCFKNVSTLQSKRRVNGSHPWWQQWVQPQRRLKNLQGEHHYSDITQHVTKQFLAGEHLPRREVLPHLHKKISREQNNCLHAWKSAGNLSCEHEIPLSGAAVQELSLPFSALISFEPRAPRTMFRSLKVVLFSKTPICTIPSLPSTRWTVILNIRYRTSAKRAVMWRKGLLVFFFFFGICKFRNRIPEILRRLLYPSLARLLEKRL